VHQIENILCAEPQGVLTLIGAGGKTSVMFNLARLLAASGKRVLTTTTTKILYPTLEQSETVLLAPDAGSILREVSADPEGHRCFTAAAAHDPQTRKLIGFTAEDIKTFAESALFDWIIVEGDGSARKPLKAHAAHEPVIPAVTTVLVAVAGLEVLGKPLSEEIVFRSAIAAALMGLERGELITEDSIVRLITHPSGLFRGAPGEIPRYVFLNKADNTERVRAATAIAEGLTAHVGVADAVMIGQAQGGLRLHAFQPLVRRR
jgi:probable selenium-dependent hydroxylase accessory protein YqeC